MYIYKEKKIKEKKVCAYKMKIRLNYSIHIDFKIKIYENLIQNMESIYDTIYFLRWNKNFTRLLRTISKN